MDSNAIVSWSIFILALISLIISATIRNKNKEKKTLLELLNFAKENNSSISGSDHWGKTLIGVDDNEISKLFFIRITPGKYYKEVIHLSKVESCALHKVERVVVNKDIKVTVIDKIELVFTFVKNESPTVLLEFYNTDYDNLTISSELHLAQKWLGIVKSILATNKNKEVDRVKIRASFGVGERGEPSPVSENISKRNANCGVHAI